MTETHFIIPILGGVEITCQTSMHFYTGCSRICYTCMSLLYKHPRAHTHQVVECIRAGSGKAKKILVIDQDTEKEMREKV